jgi:hydrogenase/urease accessory protein HupE
VVPQTASAHLVTSGIGPFYDGVVHFLVSPEDLAVVLALALFGGLFGRTAARWLVLVLPVAWLLGTGFGLRWPGPTGSGWLPALSMLLAGLLAAVNPNVPPWLPAAVAMGLGMVHGCLNGRTMAATDTSFLAAVGIVAALGLVALLLGALTSTLRVPWQKIAARTLGSWMAASGLLALAWSVRPGS